MNTAPPRAFRRLKLTIAYDGAPFTGWQSQAHGGGIQDVIEKSLARITGTRVVVYGSGRTDARVHALGQCAHIDVPVGSMTPTAWQHALNSCLPSAIRILKVQSADDDFHARFSAYGKIYKYLIRTSEVLSPLEVGRVWHFPAAANEPILTAAAGLFQGHRDFSAFSANRGGPAPDTRRTIRRVEVSRKGTLLTLTFEGEGFLYKMIRMMVGAAARAAQGRVAVDDLRRRLNEGGPRWNYVAPAEGLYLVKVLY